MSVRRTVGVSLSNLGVDPRKIGHLGAVGRYLRDRKAFLAAGGKIDLDMPILGDYGDQAGVASGHYFHQDLLVARLISKANPSRHVDIGSRIDGFVAHVAAFRDIDVIDIRPLRSPDHPQIKFLQCDLMTPDHELVDSTPSLSCLHALEHFGLGRYGDPIDPQGHLRAFPNMVSMLKSGGVFYLSVPVGRPSVQFNAHRVFDPREPLSWSDDLRLARFDYVNDQGDLIQDSAPVEALDLAYGCGIYSFLKAK